jgi:hypothetical protein
MINSVIGYVRHHHYGGGNADNSLRADFDAPDIDIEFRWFGHDTALLRFLRAVFRGDLDMWTKFRMLGKGGQTDVRLGKHLTHRPSLRDQL